MRRAVQDLRTVPTAGRRTSEGQSTDAFSRNQATNAENYHAKAQKRKGRKTNEGAAHRRGLRSYPNNKASQETPILKTMPQQERTEKTEENSNSLFSPLSPVGSFVRGHARFSGRTTFQPQRSQRSRAFARPQPKENHEIRETHENEPSTMPVRPRRARPGGAMTLHYVQAPSLPPRRVRWGLSIGSSLVSAKSWPPPR